MASTTSPGSTAASEAVVPHHTPMSERQQLALIKRLEKASAMAARQNNQDGKKSTI